MPAFGREDFFVGECNELAVHWVEEWPISWLPFPALILYGETGCGKSHLAEVWRKISNADIITADDFQTMSEDTILSTTKNLVIDGLELLIGRKEEEKKLFHLYNHFVQTGQFFLGTSRVSPERLQFQIKDLSSRLRAVPNAEITPPDDDLLFKVLAKRFHDQGYIATENALTYAVTRMERSWVGVDTLVNKAIITATAEKRQITLLLLKGSIENPAK